MKNRGFTCQIPNEYGHWLSLLLEPLDCSKYRWTLGREEAYFWMDGELEPLFPRESNALEGHDFVACLKNEAPQYIIFADFKAFPNGSKLKKPIATYEDFELSDCELVLLIVDCTYVTLYCKDQALLSDLFANAEYLKVSELAYITDQNDERTSLSI